MMNEASRQTESGERVHAWNPGQYERAAGFVAGQLGADVVEWIGAERFAGRRVLDLGCGDGDLSERLVELGADVTGVDSSATMIAAARKRGIPAEVFDAREVGEYAAQSTDAPACGEASPFDTVFTNATLHWIPEKDRVVAGVRRVLKPGGVFAGEFGGAGCVVMVREAVREAGRELFGGEITPRFPWHFITEAEFRGILEAQGFRVRRILSFDRRPVLPEGIVGWLETFGSTIFDEAKVSVKQRRGVWEAAQAKLESRLYYDGGWHADYVRLRFEATREG
ncbi:MAG: class I SAM-dependent methyltransferase [bacterium]|nr:class I SAM-dependent methyltransferase [bacterium]